LIIRKAKPEDKIPILAFLQNTFRWGDYIDKVWDDWLAKKTLLTVEENGIPIGIGNFSLSRHQIWIEGLRINPKFRRKGYASALVCKMESMAKKNCKISRMLIASGNSKSLKMAKSLEYTLESKWWLYNLMPKKLATTVHPATKLEQFEKLIESDTYSESWEWLPLDKPALLELVKKRRIVVAMQNKKPAGVGIWNKSDIDKGVLQLGYLNGTKSGICAILRYMQNKGFALKSKRIQVLTQKILTEPDLDRRMLFFLMKKELGAHH
jgi:GNAT superfamily N-acetyltransferase